MYRFHKFPWYAIVILYANGSTDAILIEQLRYHIEYFFELKKTSPIFSSIVGDNLAFDFTSIPVILKRLAKKEAFVFLNFNIRDIQTDFSVIYRDLPGFKVYGRQCQSMEQWNYLNEIVSNYDCGKLGVQVLNDQQTFQNLGTNWIDPIGFRSFVQNEKQRLLKKEDDFYD